MGHHRDDGGPGAQRHPDEARPPTEVDGVAVQPGAARLPVAAGVVEDRGPVAEARLGLAPGGGDRPDAPQERPDHRQAEEQVVGQGVGGRVEAPSLQDGLPGDPGIGHVEEAVVVADHQDRALGREVLGAADLRGEIAREGSNPGPVALDGLRVPVGRRFAPVPDPPGQRDERTGYLGVEVPVPPDRQLGCALGHDRPFSIPQLFAPTGAAARVDGPQSTQPLRWPPRLGPSPLVGGLPGRETVGDSDDAQREVGPMAQPRDLRQRIDHLVERAENEVLDASRQLAEGITRGSQRVVPPVSQDLERVVDEVFDFAERVLKGQRKMVNDLVKSINEERRRAPWDAGRQATARAAKRLPARWRGAKKAGTKKAGTKKAGAKKAGTKTAGAKKAGTKKAGAKKAGATKRSGSR